MIKLEIIVLSNNTVLPFQQLQKTDGLDFVELNKLFATQSLAEHGLGFLINIYDMDNFDNQWNQKSLKRIIFDTGGKKLTFLHNLDIRGHNIYDTDYIVLSHWHYDHTGSLYNILERIKKEVLIISHGDAKYERFFKRSTDVQNSDLLGKSREEISHLLSESKIVSQEAADLDKIANLSGKLFFSKQPYEIINSDDIKITVSGEIPRTHEEEDFDNFFLLKDEKLNVDKVLDDKCIIIDSNPNLIVLTGCCHAGLMNTLDYVKSLTDKDITHVIGGFHLGGASRERIRSTIRYLKTFQDSYKSLYLFPIHCSGERFIQEVNTSRIPDTKAYNCSVGTVFNMKGGGF